MKINNLDMRELKIPFKQSFSHASATRKVTEAVLVSASSEDSTGYGEGCPRSYVTGESIESSQKFFNDHKSDIFELENLVDLKNWVQANQSAIDQNPAAWCAIELALLDLLAKEAEQSVERLLSLPELSGRFQYTAVLGASSLDAHKKQLQLYSFAGFKDFKVKISGNLEEDLPRFAAINELGNEIRVRLDANNLWKNSEQALDYIASLDTKFIAIEEPLPVGDYRGGTAIFEALNAPIILDESFLQLAQFDHLVENPKNWIINLRISKMGGLLRSMAIAEKAKTLKFPIIIGAQVGETSILTRSALTIANAYGDILLAQEGAFGTNLLERDIVEKSLMFGAGGRLEASEVDELHILDSIA